MATYYVRTSQVRAEASGPTVGISSPMQYPSGRFYWFDGSDAAATDPDGVWTDETNADDMDISTVASVNTNGSALTNFLKIEGTNAPGSGPAITSVTLWVRMGAGSVATTSLFAAYTDGEGQTLVSWQPAAEQTSNPRWYTDASAILGVPSGGWTWAKVQALEFKAYRISSTGLLEIAGAGVLVKTADTGVTAAEPFYTIDEAANVVAAGDTVYVGAGTYREQVTMDTSGSSGSQITYVADVDGSQTGDPGLVVISVFTDSNTVTRTTCWDPDGRTFITVRGFVMQGGIGANAPVYDGNTTAQNYEGVIFEDCVFVSGPDGAGLGMRLDANGGTTPTADGLTVRRCVFQGSGITYRWDGNATADQNLKVVIEHCLFVGSAPASTSGGAALHWQIVTSSTFGSGGVTFRNNTVIGTAYGCYVQSGTPVAYPVAATNSVFLTSAQCLAKQSSNDGALTSAYNTFHAVAPLSNVTAGTGDRQETSTFLLGGIADYPLYRFLGWSPYKPFEPMRPNDDTDWTSPIGDGSGSPTFDLYNNLRPMHGTAADRGAVEGRARPERETTTIDTGSTAVRFEGAGYHDMLVPVAATSTTVTVKARKDANYTGTAPQLVVMNIPGVADQTDTHAVAADTWDTLTVTFTPTAAGVARIRLLSSDTSATGRSFFDTLTVT